MTTGSWLPSPGAEGKEEDEDEEETLGTQASHIPNSFMDMILHDHSLSMEGKP